MIALLVRTGYASAHLAATRYWLGGVTEAGDCGDGWRLAVSEGRPHDLDRATQDYVRETGRPVLLAEIVDDRFALVYNAVPGDGTRVAVLGLDAAVQDGLDLAEYREHEALRELPAWAAAAGTAPDPGGLERTLLHPGGDGLGFTLFSALLSGLGVPGFLDVELPEPSEPPGRPRQTVSAEAVLLVRSSRKVPKLRAARDWPGAWQDGEQRFKGGWRLAGSADWPADIPAAMEAFATETRGPVILACAADAGFAIVQGTSQPGRHWSSVVGLDAAHDAGHCTNFHHSERDRFYEDSLGWSADAGLVCDEPLLRAAYDRPGGPGEEVALLMVLFAGLGVPGLEHVPPDWDGSPLDSGGRGLGGWNIGFEIDFG
ncbi:hypothetical protein [Actinomadura fibrosa]|uniref:Uncharacterized protein n=1 Tax=Actinomadura fibrosa TaxID=111802 RepID=A0ABW2XVI6_9ACTN|nr:hypothetical protein [Actinomadura fibrosa]